MTDTHEETERERADRHVGARIRNRRRELGISQAKLAEALGVSFQQVQKYEMGANRVSASTLWRLSQMLDTSPGYWFDGLPGETEEAIRYDRAARLLLTDDGQALARAYAAIPTRSARLALLGVARALAGQNDMQESSAGERADDATAVMNAAETHARCVRLSADAGHGAE